MTTPTDSPAPPPEDAPPAYRPAAAAEPVAPPPTPPPTATAMLPPGPGFAEPYAHPFAPVARAPRAPWVNPARRGHLAALALVGALLFGGGGVLLGHAMSNHGDRHGVMRFERGPGPGEHGLRRGQLPRYAPGPQRRGPQGSGAPVPRPTPTGSATS